MTFFQSYFLFMHISKCVLNSFNQCRLHAVRTTRPWLQNFPPCTSVTWRGSPRLHSRNIQLMADSHGHFPHPFPSLGNNCSSVSAPLPLILYSRVEAAHCQRCSVPEKRTHTTDANSKSCRWTERYGDGMGAAAQPGFLSIWRIVCVGTKSLQKYI